MNETRQRMQVADLTEKELRIIAMETELKRTIVNMKRNGIRVDRTAVASMLKKHEEEANE